MKKTILISIAIIFVLSSCRKTLDLSISDDEKKIVLNGILYPDSVVKVNISRSLGVLEDDSTNFQFLNKATAKLYENDNYIETLIFDSMGFYHSTIIPDLTKSYKLEIESEGIEKAVGRISFMKPVEFTISDMEYSIEEVTDTFIVQPEDYYDDPIEKDTTYQQINISCKFKIDDYEEEHNYYAIQVYTYGFRIYTNSMYYNDDDYDGFNQMGESKMLEINTNYYLDNNNTLIENSTFYNHGILILQDDLFNGQTLTLNLDIDFTTFDLQPIYIKMYSVPKDYINYVKSEDKYWQAHYNPFSQPVNVFSNIENGFGVFTAFGLHEQIINLN